MDNNWTEEKPVKKAQVILFTPRKGVEASKNVNNFIKMCRSKLTIFGKSLDWEANFWVVNGMYDKNSSTSRRGFSFVNFDNAGARSTNEVKFVPMAKPFLDFAKAYMRYGYGFNSHESFQQKLAGLRAVEKVLIETSIDGTPRIELVTPAVLNRALQLLIRKNRGSAYTSGCLLRKLALFLNENLMVNVGFNWVNTRIKSGYPSIRVGKEFDEIRKQKLPSNAAIKALPLIYQAATSPLDIIISSMTVIFLSAPDRFNEVQRLRADCWHEDQVADGKKVYGLRWNTSKGGDPQINWIPSEMVDICKEALNRIKSQTQEARKMALWYENNPDMLYLPEGWEHLRRQKYVIGEDIYQIIGLSKAEKVSDWAKLRKVPTFKIQRKKEGTSFVNAYFFSDIEKTIVSLLPKGFPIFDNKTGMKYSDALLIVPLKLSHSTNFTSLCMFTPISINVFNDQLGASSNNRKSSIFSRHGFIEPDGSPIKMTSHSFRHLLTTLALKKRLGYVIATLWRKSKDIKQTKAYDHRTGDEILELLREANPEQLNGSLGLSSNAPVSHEEFMELMFPCAHTTQYGFCVHDWQLLPCQKLCDCLNCSEHVCIKGDPSKTTRIKKELEEAEVQLARDEEAIKRGELGADRWYDYNLKQVERLRQLVKVLEDPKVPEGAVIQMISPDEFSFVGHAINSRLELDDEDAETLRHMLLRLQNPLDGILPTAASIIVA